MAMASADVLYSEDLGINLGPKAQETAVIGDAPQASKNVLKWLYGRAKVRVRQYLENSGLYGDVKLIKDVPAATEVIDPDEAGGLIKGHTDSTKVVFNTCILPYTKSHSKLKQRLMGYRDKFSRYVLEKVLLKPEETIEETGTHELLHVVQIKKGLYSHAEDISHKYVKDHLPKHLKPLSKVLTWLIRPYVEPMEGLTEATREHSRGLTPREIKRKFGEGITTYDHYGATAVSAMEERPPSHLYTGNDQAIYGKMERFLRNYYNSTGFGRRLQTAFA